MKTDAKLFLGLFVAFIAATIIGTITHELGHYVVGKYFGYDVAINYSAMYFRSYGSDDPVPVYEDLLITLGGPIQTMLTGILGLVLLIIHRESFYKAARLSVKQWAIIMITLFWLRQSANLCMWLAHYFINGDFRAKTDEIKIARFLELPDWILISTTGVIGLVILGIVVQKFIPKSERLIFLSAGLTGGVTGYLLWLVYFGKYIMP